MFRMCMHTSIARQYIDLIKTALSQVKSDYFKLPTTYKSSGIVRERVFCYELYHQMRSTMTNLIINGEIDKRGHIDFVKKDQKNPDFVYHIPGSHEGNTLVIEVKGRLNRLDYIGKDFNTITNFIEEYGYKAGVFVLYNHSLEELMQSAGQFLRNYRSRSSASSIYILAIKRHGIDCEELKLSEWN
jgi:hypothetical protein